MAVLILALPAHAVYQLVVVDKPFHARSLSGVVLDPGGAPVEAVTVEDYDAGWQRILATTATDKNGYFRFPDASRGTAHHLQFKARGFNPLRVTVVLRLFAGNGLRFHLPIGG